MKTFILLFLLSLSAMANTYQNGTDLKKYCGLISPEVYEIQSNGKWYEFPVLYSDRSNGRGMKQIPLKGTHNRTLGILRDLRMRGHGKEVCIEGYLTTCMPGDRSVCLVATKISIPR